MFTFLPGRYKISSDLTTLRIHNADDENTAVTGNFFKNDTFIIYQVFPVNKKSIIWGLLTTPDAAVKKYVAMSVSGRDKVVRFAMLPTPDQATFEEVLLMKMSNLEFIFAQLNQKMDELLKR